MIYMLLAVIIPALGITFVIMISSFVGLSESAVKLIFYGLFAFAVLFQLILFGMIKSRRPNLLGD